MTAGPWTMGFPDAIGTGGREDDDVGGNADMNEGTSTVGDGASSAPGPVARGNPNAVLAPVAVAQFMVVLDATIVNIALPTIHPAGLARPRAQTLRRWRSPSPAA